MALVKIDERRKMKTKRMRFTPEQCVWTRAVARCVEVVTARTMMLIVSSRGASEAYLAMI